MEEALIALLLGDSAIRALVADRVFPNLRRQGSDLPALVLTVIDNAPGYHLRGQLGVSLPLVQVDAYALTYAAAKLLARAVRACVGAYSDATLKALFVVSDRDLPEPAADGQPAIFRVCLGIRPVYQPT